ncbi:MAG: helix-turn-helix domain-containing protein [Gloeomargarita sp. SKYBB_i_bin120]|nr:hypothetical protein [Gloeomargarita sp. SKYG98]MCS7293297.1 hypothetical protein [Gloeomargarita sp. SKYB120]MDW8178862.1 helix-turn-helix domain-containing protein [Gloeomargarita sp. SKYBB_i_bin120]
MPNIVCLAIVQLSFGRLHGCIASYRYLAARLGISRVWVVALVARLEALGLVRRHPRFKPGTRHRLSNLLEVPGVTASLEIPWRGALPNGAAADLLPPPTLEQLIAGLEQVFAQLQDYADPNYARLSLQSWWRQARKSPVIAQFCRWYAQQREQLRKPVQVIGAYVSACVQRFSHYNATFFEEMRQWLTRYQAAEQARQQQVAHAQAVATTIAQDKAQRAEELRQHIANYEQALATIPTNLPLANQERMRALYTRRIAALQAELDELLKND